ncbi:hypothetical protein T492DRAFT_1099169, partial [Pavlovales sp. CCMP2436]
MWSSDDLRRSLSKEENIVKLLKEIQKRPGNKQCADCTSRQPYVVLNFNVFACTTCSGIQCAPACPSSRPLHNARLQARSQDHPPSPNPRPALRRAAARYRTASSRWACPFLSRRRWTRLTRAATTRPRASTWPPGRMQNSR